MPLDGTTLAVLVMVGVIVGLVLAFAGPPFLRGFREARERRGIDLNMEHRVEAELAEEQMGEQQWRDDIDSQLDRQVERWREEQP